MIGSLWISSVRFMRRHPVQAILSVLGVALGVAIVVSVDLANESASRAFAFSTQAISGRATHRIVGGPSGVDERVYRTLRVELGLRSVAPVVEGYVSSPRLPGRTLQLLGIDPTAESAFRSHLGSERIESDGFFSTFGSVIVSSDTAAEMNVQVGETFPIDVAGVEKTLTIAGTISPENEASRQALANLVIADISTAQELFGMSGRLSRIDVILPVESEQNDLLGRIKTILPPNTQIVRASQQAESAEQMTRSFRLNLQAMSLLALICGMFLIYNTMTFSVLQRRTWIGTMRALGVTRGELFGVVLWEAAMIGAIGSVIGLVAGVALGNGLVRLVTQTINDLFFVVSVRNVAVLPGTVIKGVAMGLGATLIAALPSAREAMHAPPRATLSRSVVESGARRSIPRLTVSGAALFTVGVACLLLSHKSLIVSFIGIFALILGCALFVPLATVGAMAVARPVMAGAFGVLGAMATRGVVSTLSRTGVAIAALMIAVSVTVGVGVMTDSFRKTVNRWVGKTLTADIYIAAPIEVRDNTPVGLDPALVERLGKIDGVAQQTTYRGVEIPSPNGFEPLVVAELGDRGYEAFDLLDGDPKAVWGEFQNDDIVFISEPYQHHRGVQRGDFVTMASDRGERSFRVVGVYYDYNAPQGEVMMSRRTYNRYWDDRVVVSTGLIAQDGVAVESILKEARRVAGESSQSVFIRSNEAIRRAGMEIFDRTFAITNVLRLLTTVVAFIGVLSAFMALQLERAREFGVLRANGMTPGQVWQLVVTQTGLMGLSAGLFSLPVGALMGAVMIGVINKRSFGWTLKMVVAPEILGQAVVMAVGAALLAGLYPAWRMARSSPALALREE